MNRGEAMQALLGLGVDGPERATVEIPTEAVVGVVRWAQDQNKKGHTPFAGTIVKKLRNGGLAGYGELAGPVQMWWRNWQGREQWIETNVSELDYEYAESAIISLVQQKKNPTPETVRACAQLLEQDQLAHDEKCRQAVKGQRSLAAEGAPPRGASLSDRDTRPSPPGETARRSPEGLATPSAANEQKAAA